MAEFNWNYEKWHSQSDSGAFCSSVILCLPRNVKKNFSFLGRGKSYQIRRKARTPVKSKKGSGELMERKRLGRWQIVKWSPNGGKRVKIEH
jgi:hypothetical protein